MDQEEFTEQRQDLCPKDTKWVSNMCLHLLLQSYQLGRLFFFFFLAIKWITYIFFHLEFFPLLVNWVTPIWPSKWQLKHLLT